MANQNEDIRLVARIETKGDPNAARRAGEADARAYNEAFARVAGGGMWKSPMVSSGGKPAGLLGPGNQPLLLPAASESTIREQARKQARLEANALRNAREREARTIRLSAITPGRAAELSRQPFASMSAADELAVRATYGPPPPRPPMFGGGGGGFGGGGGGRGRSDRGPDITETTRALGDASRRVRAFTGNPFEVLSTLSQTITGVRKLRVGIDQVTMELQNLQTAYRNETNAAKRASLRKDIESKKTQAAGLVAQTQGAGFKARAGVDFLVSNFITSGFLFTGFTIMQNAFNAVAGELYNFGANLLDSGRNAREAVTTFAESLKSAGGATKFAQELNLVPGSKLAIFASTVELSQTASAQLGLFGESAAAYGLSGGNAPVFSESDLEKFRKGLMGQFVRDTGFGMKSVLPGVNLSPMNADYFTGLQDLQTIESGLRSLVANFEDPLVRKALLTLIDDAVTAQRQRFPGRTGAPGGVTQLTEVVDAILNAAKGPAFAQAYSSAVQAQTYPGGLPPGAAANVSSLQTLFANTGILSRSQMTPLQRAQAALDRAQAAASGASGAMQIQEARRKVGQAGVATAGDTVFDVAQRIINAQGELDKTKRQVGMQNNIARLTAKVATEKTVEDSLKAMKAIEADAATLAPDVAKALSEQLIKIKVEGADDRISKGLADLIQYVLNLSTKNKTTIPGSRPGSNT